MDSTIYKASIYKGKGIYKGAGGIYKGRGVYNDGGGGSSPIPPEYTAYDWIQFDGASSTYTWLPIIQIDIDNNENCEFVFTYAIINKNRGKQILRARGYPNNSPQVLFLEISTYYGEQTTWSGFQNGGSNDWPSPNANIKYYDEKSTLSIIGDKIKDFTTNEILATCPGGYSIVSFMNKGLMLVPADDRPMKSYGGMIIKNGVTIYEWHPVKENDTGKCGFYDIVNNVFTTFADPAAFSHWTAGNDT